MSPRSRKDDGFNSSNNHIRKENVHHQPRSCYQGSYIWKNVLLTLNQEYLNSCTPLTAQNHTTKQHFITIHACVDQVLLWSYSWRIYSTQEEIQLISTMEPRYCSGTYLIHDSELQSLRGHLLAEQSRCFKLEIQFH
nr:hypothetical protein [Tanacetum cinerariifolium]